MKRFSDEVELTASAIMHFSFKVESNYTDTNLQLLLLHSNKWERCQVGFLFSACKVRSTLARVICYWCLFIVVSLFRLGILFNMWHNNKINQSGLQFPHYIIPIGHTTSLL